MVPSKEKLEVPFKTLSSIHILSSTILVLLISYLDNESLFPSNEI
jgi:hypothetical protein